jgi:hypothetical protein
MKKNETKEDIENKRVEKENKEITSFVRTEAWGIIKNKLTDLVADMQNIANIPDKSPEQVVVEIKARKLSCVILLNWLREIEGTANSINNQEVEEKSFYVFKE